MGVSSRYCIHWTEYQRAARRVIRSLKKAIAPRVTAGRWVGRRSELRGLRVGVDAFRLRSAERGGPGPLDPDC